MSDYRVTLPNGSTFAYVGDRGRALRLAGSLGGGVDRRDGSGWVVVLGGSL